MARAFSSYCSSSLPSVWRSPGVGILGVPTQVKGGIIPIGGLQAGRYFHTAAECAQEAEFRFVAEEAGAFDLFCSVPGYQELGMVATLNARRLTRVLCCGATAVQAQLLC